ncbi:MAG TPA: sulfatase-like hydrolase/transferase [Puia sp.]|nr:sulfatase-like hydrolase/transferase [Puia sp.]
MMKKLQGCCIALIGWMMVCGPVRGQDPLAEHFRRPPAEYSILPFWSWNNTLDSVKLNGQMDEMMDKGIYGAFMHARAGLDASATPYFSDGWWRAVESTVRHAHEKGFLSCLYDEDGWPSGSAGGRTLAANPEQYIKKALRYSRMEVTGPQELRLADGAFAIYAGRISERGAYDHASQQDLTALAGKTWSMPAGRWAVIVFTLVKDPGGQIDYLDSAAVAAFLHITHEEYYRRLSPYFGGTIPGVFFDEIYANLQDRQNNMVWTDDFAEQFRRRKGYDVRGILPLLVYDDPKRSYAARHDFFEVARDLYNRAWFRQYAKWGADHGIWVTGHTTEEMSNYIRQMDYFNTMGQLQRPCTDNEDFRYGYPRVIDWYDPKQMSSIGHIYGSQRVAAEAMGSGGYTILPEEYRYGFSMLGVYGVNMFVPHLFHYSTARPENQADWPPSWFYQNPYWKYFKPLAEHGARVSFMVSQGKHVCGTAILYPTTQLWLNGYSGPVDDGYYKEVQRQLLESHIDYDIVDPESLAAAATDGGVLGIGQEQYKVLILPDLKAIRRDVMEKVNAFAAAGGIVIGLRGLPSASEKGDPTDAYIVRSMEGLFGIAPSALRQEQYYRWDKQRVHNYIEHMNGAKGGGIFTRDADALPVIISRWQRRDILVEGEGNAWLQYQHRQAGAREVYFLVNSHKEAETFKVSLAEQGRPFCWDPETGERKELTNYRINRGRLELLLSFRPWQGYFVVLEPGPLLDKGMLADVRGLEDAKVAREGDSVVVSGWRAMPKGIGLDGSWDFQLCPHALDEKWMGALEADTLAMPVMEFAVEGAGRRTEGRWKTIKVKDDLSSMRGASRYVSGWSGSWISYYDHSRHLPDVGGGVAWFRKELTVEEGVRGASLDITADAGYELFINGKRVGSGEGWRQPAHYTIDGFLTKGKNIFLVKVTGLRGLLLEGELELGSGRRVVLRTDSSWRVSRDEAEWREAFLYSAPPLGPWGDIGRPGHVVHFPCVAWYRQLLPPGAKAIIRPEVRGSYEVFVDGRRVKFGAGNMAGIDGAGRGELTMRVVLSLANGGLQEPVKVVCGKTPMPLRSWGELGLGWYSGRALYTRKVSIPADYISPGVKLMLDLGAVDHFAEIWVNGRLVSYHPWPPFRADISSYVHAGENEVAVVVANLLANQASWDLLDANIDNSPARWWNNGSILRERERLASGLLGPVRIIPYVRDSAREAVREDVGEAGRTSAGRRGPTNGAEAGRVKRPRPNIVLIMADDMGFSDIGCYGGEIHTPNIDGLAREGIRFTRMYNNAWCSPSRASLMTGVFPHQAGMAVLADPRTGPPGPYEGYLNDSCVTLAEVLKGAGYRTVLAGKWHLGEARPRWPVERGFDHYFGLISGAANYFDITKDKAANIRRHMALDGEAYTPPKEGFYMTDAITRYAVDAVTGQAGGSAARMDQREGPDDKPLFLYVAYTAPHWPLQALPEDIARYRDSYRMGWDSLRAARYERQRAMGLWGDGMKLSPRDEDVHAWESLTEAQKDSMALKMAIYAAQVDRMDQGIGKILAAIKASGKEDNTLVIFLSDNGGCAEGGIWGFDKRGNGIPPGGVNSFMSYGQSWANASNTPFRYFKKWLHEGGISTPFIVRWPAAIVEERRGGFIPQVGHLADLMPTLCSIAGAGFPERYKGKDVRGPEGQSLSAAIEEGVVAGHRPLFWELNGHKAMLSGSYKLVSAGDGAPWELYDLDKDRAELDDLAGKCPERVKEMAGQWEAWAARVGVVKGRVSKDE